MYQFPTCKGQQETWQLVTPKSTPQHGVIPLTAWGLGVEMNDHVWCQYDGVDDAYTCIKFSVRHNVKDDNILSPKHSILNNVLYAISVNSVIIIAEQ